MSTPELLVFFDLETTFPIGGGGGGGSFEVLEFGAIVVCPKTLIELQTYSTLVRPTDANIISQLPDRCNGITQDMLNAAKTFNEIADEVYNILHGRVWVGYNMLALDRHRLRDAFTKIHRQAPEAKNIIDTLSLLTRLFGKRTKNMKMDTLASFFGLGQQIHRSVDNIRMNLKVLQRCATILSLERGYPNIFTTDSLISPDATAMEEETGSESPDDYFVELDKILIPSIIASLVPFDLGTQRIQILHKGVVLQVCSTRLKVRIGINSKFVDHSGQPRLHFVVDASPILCEVLDVCDNLAERLSVDSGSNSKWRRMLTKKAGFKTVRLHLPTEADGTVPRCIGIYSKVSSTSTPQKVVLSNVSELDSLFIPGNFVDAYFSLNSYDYQENTGFRLVAKKLIVHLS